MKTITTPIWLAMFSLLAALGCDKSVAEPESRNRGKGYASEGREFERRATPVKTAPPKARPIQRTITAQPAAKVPVSPDDPVKGKFDLKQATKGLKGSGDLLAAIETEAGTLKCKLFADKAPITVANFVGLARGLRPWKGPDGKWRSDQPAYDGTTFHRVIKGFMIQGGDPAGTGAGEPGYVIPDEVWEGARHDKRGQLCMANRGKNTNGMQFFIMDGAASHLDGGYTIFGHCGPDNMIEKLANTPVRGDRAISPPKIKSVKISRTGEKK